MLNLWLCFIAEYLCLGDIVCDEDDTPENKCIEKETNEALYAAIETLPEIEKRVIYLILDGKTGPEIMRIMHFRNRSIVSYWKQRAFDTLRVLMEPYR